MKSWHIPANGGDFELMAVSETTARLSAWDLTPYEVEKLNQFCARLETERLIRKSPTLSVGGEADVEISAPVHVVGAYLVTDTVRTSAQLTAIRSAFGEVTFVLKPSGDIGDLKEAVKDKKAETAVTPP